MSELERRAYDAHPNKGSRFVGTAIHRLVDRILGTDWKYRSNYGPDYTHTASGAQVELTTEAQLERHKRRYGAGVEYVTWR
jgi:hypothetical protein